MKDQRLHRIAKRQLGLFTRADANRCGFTAYQVRRRVDTGEWQQVRDNVYTHRGRPLKPMILAAAAHLAVPGSVIAGPSAALWYGLPVGDPATWLWTGPRGRSSLPGTAIFRGPLDGGDIRRADGMRITGPGRTVFDCLRVLPEDIALNVLDRALQRWWTHPAEQAQRVRDAGGRHGTARVQRLLVAGCGTRSAAERVAVAILRKAGVTGWTLNAAIYDHHGLVGYGDIVFRQARLVVEIDGWAYHTDRERFQRDRTRQNRLIAAGWTVLRFTWEDLIRRPTEVVRMINFSGTRVQ